MKTHTHEFRIFGKEKIATVVKNCTVLFLVFLFQTGLTYSQTSGQNYDNFEGTKSVHYASKNGVLDSAAKNPASNSVNSSAKCGLYVRNRSKKFDNIKMDIAGKLSGIDKYAVYTGVPPKIKMKIYTSAPVGTLVEILLGSKADNNAYPKGTHSQYQAHTTVSNAWEELEFTFAQIPEGSATSANQVDQITLLFNPNTSTSDTYYFDDLTGPSIGTNKSQTTAETTEK